MNRSATACLLTGLAILGVSPASGGARGETWCVRQFGNPPSQRFCVYSSAEDCLQSVFIGGGGICEREPVKPTKPIKPDARTRNRFPDPPRLSAW